MSNRHVRPEEVLRDPATLLAFGLGAGLSPRAPGTAGTLIAIPLYLALSELPVSIYLSVTGALFLVGIPLCAHAARRLAAHDHPGIVWDEVVGFLVTMTAAPSGLVWVLTGFLLFRLFDIAKPWPIRWADRRVKGGFGIMLDDLLAGLLSLAVLQAAFHGIHG